MDNDELDILAIGDTLDDINRRRHRNGCRLWNEL